MSPAPAEASERSIGGLAVDGWTGFVASRDSLAVCKENSGSVAPVLEDTPHSIGQRGVPPDVYVRNLLARGGRRASAGGWDL